MTEWKTYKIGDLCKISSSKRIFAKEYKDSGIPFYRGKEIIEKQKGNKISTELYISQERYDEIKAKHGVPLKGDMLLTSVGTLGIPYIVQDEVFYFKDGNLTWFYNFEGIDSRYLYYWFLSPIGKMNMDSKAIGSTQKALTIETLSKFEISLPSLEEQRRIAGILGAIDDKIENNRRINTNLELQAQALYKQWFVDNRNKDWETLTLDDVAAISAGGDKPQVCSEQKTQECNIPIYSNSIDREGLYGYTNNPRIIENSITISARGTIGYVCLRTEPYVPIVRLISVIPTHDNMSAYFLYLWALTQNISGTGTTQQQLTVPAFRTTQIVVPSQEILIRFNKVVKPIFDCIKQNKAENETLATLRDTLLPKLMNGEIK